MTSRTRTAALALVAAALVAGCGGESKTDDYKAGMRQVGDEISEASAAVSEVRADSSVAEKSEAIDAQRAAIQKAADRASDLDPPEDAAKSHKQLVEALDDYAELLGELAAATGDSGKEAEIIGDVGPIVDKLSKASKALEKQGYHFGDGKGDA